MCVIVDENFIVGDDGRPIRHNKGDGYSSEPYVVCEDDVVMVCRMSCEDDVVMACRMLSVRMTWGWCVECEDDVVMAY